MAEPTLEQINQEYTQLCLRLGDTLYKSVIQMSKLDNAAFKIKAETAITTPDIKTETLEKTT